MADNRITGARLKNHWAYSWWKYLIMAAVVVLGVNVAFSVTAYRPPQERMLEVYLCHGWADAKQFEADMWPALLEAAPDQELLTVMNIDLSGGEPYANMQFSTYTAAQQGDVCLLPRSEVKRLAGDETWEAFADLTPYVEEGRLGLDGASYVTYPGTDGEKAVFGLATDTLYGLTQYGIDPADGVLVVMSFSGNEENAVRLLELMIDRFATEKPEGYDEWHRALKSGQTGASQVFR